MAQQAPRPNFLAGADEAFNERVRFFQEFLTQDFNRSQYKDQLVKMLHKDERRLIVNINHIRLQSREYADGLLEAPIDYLPAFDKALQDVAQATWNEVLPMQEFGQRKYHVGLEGSFGEHALSPRTLSAVHLGTMICIEGIVTKCSLVRPKVSRSVHYCEETKIFHSREYRDGTSLDSAAPTGAVYPKEDADGNPLTTEFGLSTYRDYQTLSIQEMPERSPAGQMPRPTDVILDGDLVDRAKPGDRIRLVGVFRSIGKHAASISATFKSIILANNIAPLEKEVHQPTITEDDAREIRKIGKRKDVFELLSRSLAPSLFGHDYIKKALLLLMLGGVEKNLENGTHLRGDINMLLIGDPSVGKSQMLRFVLNLAPLAIATTGRGSSGVGLTAAVTQDKETGERTLEAGAMVLADRGIVCIDEFDKMSDIDRVAIHEVMEQQTVTIAKAGIHTSLNARCSVLAAANPAFGSYLDEKKPFENITLPDSLLSRFDLVFVVLDKTDDEFNRAISEHITRLHRYVPDGVEEGAPISEATMQSIVSATFGSRSAQQSNTAVEQTPVFQAYNELLHIGVRAAEPSHATRGAARRSSRRQAEIEILSIPFIKKYIYYTKNKFKPVLTDDACEYISTRYAELRSREDGQQDKYRTMPMTPRTLETLIRLATAHAKCRLSKTVDVTDAEIAYELLVFALFKEVKPKKRQKRVKTTHGSESDDEDDEDTAAGGLRATVAAPADPNTAAPAAETPSVDGSVLLRRRGAGSAVTTAVTQSGRSTAANSSRLGELIDTDYSQEAGSSMVLDSSASSSVGVTDPDVGSSFSGAMARLSPARFDQFRRQLTMVRQRCQTEQPDNVEVTMGTIMSMINTGLEGNDVFNVGQVRGSLKSMSDDNMGVWLQDDGDVVMFI
ncbi:MCM2/3/5 family-domain-containing protein [Entophlyctis helioformis]|nr:MCM2/3/5 family-domain-containing protein [Entophlyctis helioformis]